MIYTYAADLYCEDCGRLIMYDLDSAGKRPEDPEDEHTYDSGDYPKSFYGEVETDTPYHCASGKGCPNAVRVPHEPGTLLARYVGPILTDALTREGQRYVAEAISYDILDGNVYSVSVQLWFPEFYEYLHDVPFPHADAMVRDLLHYVNGG